MDREDALKEIARRIAKATETYEAAYARALETPQGQSLYAESAAPSRQRMEKVETSNAVIAFGGRDLVRKGEATDEADGIAKFLLTPEGARVYERMRNAM